MTTDVSFQNFEETISKLIANQTKAVVLFTSDKNNDGSYWCPDCEAIKHLYSTFQDEAKKANLPLYIFLAGDRPTWKNPQNKIRKHKSVLLTSVPTLGYFDGKKVTRRLVEGQILSSQQRELIYE